MLFPPTSARIGVKLYYSAWQVALPSYCSAWSEALSFCSAWREALLLLLRHSAVLPSSARHSPPPSAQHGKRFSSSYCPGMALSSTYCSAFSSHCPAWRKVLFSYCSIRCLQGPRLLLSALIILQHVVQVTLLFLLPGIVVGALLFCVEVLPGPCRIQPRITARDSDAQWWKLRRPPDLYDLTCRFVRNLNEEKRLFD